MNNKGQTTVLFSLIISVLFLFTLTALEVGRIYMSKVKIRACVHSTKSSIMADYNSELFERYHLLFMDPTYGTDSEAALEEKVKDYLESSLNGENGNISGIYQFEIDEISFSSKAGILEEDMQCLKDQITEYQKTAGVIQHAKQLAENLKKDHTDMEQAVKETEINGVEFAEEKEQNQEKADPQKIQKEDKRKVTDPRDTLKDALKYGTLSFLLSKDCDISKATYDLTTFPSSQYQEQKEEEKDNQFQDIGVLKSFLKNFVQEDLSGTLMEQAAFADYVNANFSNATAPREDSVMKCEFEYILKGKASDYENLEAVVNDIIWQRMLVNYAYLLGDSEKKSEALTLATAICIATGTEGLIEVVKYLLLGCWSYGESLCEMKSLLAGEKIAYVKTKENWNTDLKNLVAGEAVKKTENGLGYSDYLMILLAGKSAKKQDNAYARMLDVIQLNLQVIDPDFKVANCVGSFWIQGKVSVNSMFVKGKEKTIYEYYFEEECSYE